MDVFSTLDGQLFVWDSEKAALNIAHHGIRFERAREALLGVTKCQPRARGPAGLHRPHHEL